MQQQYSPGLASAILLATAGSESVSCVLAGAVRVTEQRGPCTSFEVVLHHCRWPRGWIEPWAIKCPSQWVGPPLRPALLTWCTPSLERGIAQASWRPEHHSRGKRETGESARQKSFDHRHRACDEGSSVACKAAAYVGCEHGSSRPHPLSAMEQCRYTCCSCIISLWCVATVLA